ncbi:DNA circularization protein [Aquitalea aquatica]|uniref:DNA circularization N-terminal domain-containing protein n=1 Tax=Aquitalea aquatica TaxID=3044273 RepID=A0A838YAQ0_9NEIS|nr:DNA circularization N-terminal domain-containing protein [Aquitalea magnusonii]MBA4709577.1 DNA circularization N-terminal domain-containing protein [Aquitalea magnusonii]
MSWKDNLLDASFRGVVFDCLQTEDEAERDTASHAYPYMDGEDVEDLGRKARQLRLTAVFFGADYDSRLQTFLQMLDEPGHGELIHPVFGSMARMQLLRHAVRHTAEDVDYCTVELTLKEATPSQPFFVRQLPAQQAQGLALQADMARQAGIAVFDQALSQLKQWQANLAPLQALGAVMTGTLAAVRSQLHGLVAETISLLDSPRAFAAELVGLLDGLVDLRGFDTETIASDWNSLARQLDRIVLLPAQLAHPSNASDAASPIDNVPSAGEENAIAAPTLPPREQDVAQLTALVQAVAASTLASTASDLLADQAEQPTLTPPQLETMANDVRRLLQVSMDSHHKAYPLEQARPVIEALKDTALAVQEAARAVIALAPPLIQRRVEQDGNLHLQAFAWYGDYRRAAELARLNPALRNPNHLQAGDLLNAYAH